MSEQTKISWCDSTVNWWEGCTMVSTGCANCYAKARDDRQMIEPVSHWGKGAPRRKSKSAVKAALAMNRKPWICNECGSAFTLAEFEGTKGDTCSCYSPCHKRRIFSLSLGDWLDDEVPIDWLCEMLDTIRRCDQVTWILCTKRPENFTPRLTDVMRWFEDHPQTKNNDETWKWCLDWVCAGHEANPQIPENIILLTSVENQEQADIRIPELLKIPAVCRGLSLEPLLANVSLDPHWLGAGGRSGSNYQQPQIDWLIIGGESGPNARPCNVDWIRSLVAQGKAAGVAMFVKQLGACYEDPINGITGAIVKADESIVGKLQYLRDKKGGDPAEWPADLRVREWPKGF